MASIQYKMVNSTINVFAILLGFATLLIPCVGYTKDISANSIYTYAQKNDTKSLSKHIKDIDITDSKGNTALCLAMIDKNDKAAKVLKKAGANEKAKCVKAIPSENGFWNNKTKWGFIGALLGGGAIAAASGSGGGGSSSGSKNDTGTMPDDNMPTVLECKNGTQVGNSCKCDTGWAGTTCTEADSNHIIGDDGKLYPKLNCQNGGTQTGATCTGCNEGWTGATCEIAKTCTGFKEECADNEYETGNKCPTGDNVWKECKLRTNLNCAEKAKNEDKCLSCNAGDYLSGGKCLTHNNKTCAEYVDGTDNCKTCNTNYYLNGNVCMENTVDHCISKSQESNICLQCETGYTGDKCDSCASGYYKNGSQCSKQDDIEHCTVMTENANTCATCETGYIGDRCDSCASGYYKNGSQCLKQDVIEHCTVMTENANTCATCETGYTGDKCDSCASGYYKDGAQCLKQDVIEHCTAMSANANTCETCETGYTGDRCDSCESGYYKDGNQCLKQDNIAHCTAMSANANTCETCEAGYTGGRCDSCESGYYKDGAQCKKQDEIAHCTAMSANANTCATCEAGYTGDKCDSCTNGYIMDNGTCYLKLNCQNGGTQQGNECICSGLFSGKLCQNTLCPGEIIDGKCVAKNDIKNNSEITMDIQGDIIGEDGNKTDIVGLYSENHPVGNAYGQNSVGLIKITNNGDGDIYGIYANDIVYNEYYYASSYYVGSRTTATIDIINKSDSNVYGIYSTQKIYNSYYGGNTSQYVSGKGIVKITNIGNGLVYGLYSTSDAINAYGSQASNATYQGNATQTGNIFIQNAGDSNVYGIYSLSNIYNAYTDKSGTTNGIIKINNNGNGLVFGMYGSNVNNAYCVYHSDNHFQSAKGEISILNTGIGNAYGIFSKEMSNSNSSIIKMANLGSGIAVGTYSTSNATNSGDIAIHNLGDGVAIGMYGKGRTIDNRGNITITRAGYTDDNLTPDDTSDDTIYKASSETGGIAIGIYGGSGTTITNSGTITISGAEKAYGIWAEDSTVEVTNTGTISIDGNVCEGADCKQEALNSNKQAIVLNGGKLFNDGVISADNLNLDAFGGIVVASAKSKVMAKNALSGTMMMGLDNVLEGNSTTYTAKNIIEAADTTGLKLTSQSPLFDTTLGENKQDVIMTMKSFSDVLENKSLAGFLQNNYAQGNNNDLFKSLKSTETLKALNDSLDDFMGKEMFNRFAFEDFTMMRELNYSINQKLFDNKEDYISTSGSSSAFAFSGNSRYSLTNMRSGRNSLGISVAFSDINSDDGNNNNRRYDKIYNISMPMGYQTNGFNIISTTRIGYATGTYDRKGFNNQNYDGKLEKQMFGLMNEARYPLELAGWTLSPAAELNLLSYHLKGSETEKDYSLNIKSQNNYSVEAGLGLYANKRFALSKKSSLGFNTGAAVYHEFADPYKIKLGMNGMDGSFTLRDDNRSDNRVVIRSGFDFNYDNITVDGNLASYIDREYQTDASLNFKYNF